MRQPPGTINLETQEESAISPDPHVTHASKLEEAGLRLPLDAASPATGPGPPDMMAKIKAAAGTGLSLKPNPAGKGVLPDIPASREDLEAVGREADLQGKKDPAPAEAGSGAADRSYRDLFTLAPDAYLVTDGQTIIAESNQAAAAMLMMDQGSLKGQPLTHFVAAADRLAFQAILIQVRGGGGKRFGEFRLQPARDPLI